MSLYTKVEQSKKQLGRYYILFTIMFLNGTRVSETLALSHKDVLDTGQVYLRASKGSDNRLLNVSGCEAYLLDCKVNEVDPFVYMNRQAAYRHLKRLGISVLKKGRAKESVTHAFRNDYVKRLRSINLNDKELGRETGHRVSTNVRYYGKD